MVDRERAVNIVFEENSFGLPDSMESMLCRYRCPDGITRTFRAYRDAANPKRWHGFSIDEYAYEFEFEVP